MDQSVITPNNSNQQLLNSDNDSATALLQEKQARRRDNLRDVSFVEFLTVGILCYVNLINYMDRFTLAVLVLWFTNIINYVDRYTITGVLGDVKNEFNMEDDGAGFLQTVFVISYMIFAPIFGYLGDRYSRRYIMASGVALWSLTTFVGSYMTNIHWFIVFRGLVGVGEASYSTIAPTIISDLFVGNVRSKMLAFFYFAIPVGSGLGYIVGSVTGAAANNWRWGLRVTPFLGAVAVGLIAWVMEDPERGQAEDSHMKPASYKDDIRSIIKNTSFMLSTIAFTCVAFVTGALAWWGPRFIFLGLSMQPDVDISIERVSLVFGAVTMASGLVGVPLGTWLGAALVKRWPRSHPLICGVGLLISAPAMGCAMLLVQNSLYLPFVLIFIGEVALNLNWALVADMSLYVVIPPRRSTAEAFQILISHMFGDAGSPYLVGVISEKLKRTLTNNAAEAPSKFVQFKALQFSLFVTCFVEVLGAIFFLLTAIYIVRDKTKVDRAIAEAEASRVEPSHSNAQEHSAGE